MTSSFLDVQHSVSTGRFLSLARSKFESFPRHYLPRLSALSPHSVGEASPILVELFAHIPACDRRDWLISFSFCSTKKPFTFSDNTSFDRVQTVEHPLTSLNRKRFLNRKSVLSTFMRYYTQKGARRSEPSSRTTLIGEQPNPWNLLQLRDVVSRHRGAELRRRYGRLGGTSLLSPE